MEGTQYFVIEEDYVTSSVLKIVWYLMFRDLTSLTFDILLPEHQKALFLLGLKFWEQEAELECSAMFSFGVSLAIKVGIAFLLNVCCFSPGYTVHSHSTFLTCSHI